MISPKLYRIFFISLLNGLFLTSSAQVNHLGFENMTPGPCTSSNAIPGWTLQSAVNNFSNGVCATGTGNVWSSSVNEVSVISTPVLGHPYIGTIPNSPLGGTKILQLNDVNGTNNISRARTTFMVNNSNSLFTFAYCGSWDGPETCCSQSFFNIDVLNCSGNKISCLSLSLTPITPWCSSGIAGYSVTGSVCWSNWVTRSIDLSPYIGSCITMDIIVGDSYVNNRHGQIYFDGVTGFQQIGSSYCAGSNMAEICAPSGYVSYQWFAPPATPPISNMPTTVHCLSIQNPIPGDTYTILAMNSSGCQVIFTFQVVYTQVSVSSISTSSSCLLGANGSASVLASGSGGGYTYTWTNASNSVVGTNSVVNNLSPGLYKVVVGAAGLSSCGTATTTATVSARTGTTDLVKPFCGNTAFLTMGPGTNFQWYNTGGAIPSPSGTASLLAVSAPSNNSIYWLSYNSPQGCLDTIKFTLMSSNPGTTTINSSTVCSSAANGMATITIIPAGGSSAFNSWTVASIGTTPSYSFSQQGGTSTSYNLTNLPGGIYTLNVFDGSCFQSNSFTVAQNNTGFNISPSGTPTICLGNSVAASLSLTNPFPGGTASYLWLPNQYLVGGNTYPSVIITPTALPGILNVIVYTVSVLVNPGNCVLTKTWSVTSLNPVTPTISTIADHCSNAPAYTISAIPPGGLFAGIGIASNGLLTPSLALTGTNTVQYVSPGSNCNAVSSKTFLIKAAPLVSINGNTMLCIGNTTTLTAQGADSYSWSNNSINPAVIASPVKQLTLSVTGTSVNGCASTVSVNLFPMPVPTVQITGSTILCDGDTVLLVTSGANSYSWHTGQTGAVIKLSPPTSSIYTVTGFNSPACFHSVSVPFVVKKKPLLTVSGPTQTCAGYNLSYTVNGATSYTWNNLSNSNQFNVTPFYNSTYSVNGSDTNGCVSKKTFSLNVLPSPTLSVSGETFLCRGQTTTLTVSGGDSYLWSNNNSTSTIQSFQPATNMTFSVTGTFTNNCSSAMIVSIMVSDCSGLSVENDDPGISIFPNPSGNHLFIQTKQHVIVEVHDNEGRLVLIQETDRLKNEVDLSDLPAGMFFITIKDLRGENWSTKKIIKTEQ